MHAKYSTCVKYVVNIENWAKWIFIKLNYSIIDNPGVYSHRIFMNLLSFVGSMFAIFKK